MMKLGSSPAWMRMWQSIAAVVLLPCVPAIETPVPAACTLPSASAYPRTRIARRRVHHPELAFVRGSELADSLGFQSIDADDENVRELVLRVRRKLRSIGGDHLIETRRNAGYRLAGSLRRA